MYQYGHGVDQNDTEALNWYHKAAEQGYASAQNNIGWMYQQGRGVPQNDTEALNWYHKAAEQGYASAQNNIGWMYQNGRGVSQDDTKALNWYRKAAEQGHADAQYRIGRMYQERKGVPQNSTEAAKWYRKAADQNHAKAQEYLDKLLDFTITGVEVRALEPARCTAEFELELTFGSQELPATLEGKCTIFLQHGGTVTMTEITYPYSSTDLIHLTENQYKTPAKRISLSNFSNCQNILPIKISISDDRGNQSETEIQIDWSKTVR